MAQVSYGTITITDTNDIESITIEYARNQSTSTAPTSGWSTDRPTWQQGSYIWQRARIHKSGTSASQDTFGTAVCVSGSAGSTGAAGRSLTATETKYAQVAADSTETQVKTLAESRWTTNVPTYSESLPEYWVRVVNTYSNPTETEKIYYKDNGLTSAVATAASANSAALNARTDAANALQIANSANDAISDLNQYFWRKKTASTNVPAGSYVTNIPGTTYEANPAQGGFNSLVQSNGIFLRNGISTLSSWTGTELAFYQPNTNNKTLSLSSSGLNFYGSSTSSPDATLTSDGLKLVKGGIVAGTAGQSGFIYLSTENYGSNLTVNNHQASNWREVIGTKFGVDADGILYASNAEISGKIIVTSESDLSAGLSNYSTTSAMNNAISTATHDMATKTYVGDQGYQTAENVNTIISNTNVSALNDGSDYTKTDNLANTTAVQNAAKTASNYLGDTDSQAGVTLKAVNGTTTANTNTSNYIKINSSGLEIFKAGVSVAQYGDTARIGKASNSRFLINTTSLQAYNSSNVKYFEVSDSGMTYGSNTVASTTYADGKATAAQTAAEATAQGYANDASYSVEVKVDSISYANNSATLIAIPYYKGSITLPSGVTHTYQWYKGTQLLSNKTTAPTISGATTATLTLGAGSDLNALYVCIISK